MKNTKKIITAVIALLLTIPFSSWSQDSSKKDLILNLSYFMTSNNAIYIMANTKTKIAKKFTPVSGINISLFLDKDSSTNFIGKVTTDKNGLGKAIISPQLKTIWDQSPTHTFKAVSEANSDFEITNAETSITKSKLTIDTLSDGDAKTINVKVESFNGTSWSPVPGVEIKVGVSRLSGAILPAGEEASYTTDSTGKVNAVLKKTALPGDEKGNIILAAKVEDNEQLGNLTAEKTVPWGIAVKADNNFFNQRTLWSTRFRTPLWLLFMAYSIVIGVWGTIIYLVFQIIKLKKMGVTDISSV